MHGGQSVKKEAPSVNAELGRERERGGRQV